MLKLIYIFEFKLFENYKKIGISLYLSHCRRKFRIEIYSIIFDIIFIYLFLLETIIKSMKKFKFQEKFSLELIFLTNSDAVTKINEIIEPNSVEFDQLYLV